jgi:hypothetical protein
LDLYTAKQANRREGNKRQQQGVFHHILAIVFFAKRVETRARVLKVVTATVLIDIYPLSL